MNRQQRRHSAKLVDITINGVTMKVNPDSIDKSKRTLLHGEYKGNQVNSPELCLIGDTAIFWPESGKKFAVSMDKAALGVLSTKFLESEGATVTFAA